MASNKGLGKGLGALLGDFNEEPQQQSGYRMLPIYKVEPNPDQPRQDFDEEELQALSESIAVHGVIQPLTVRELPSGYYQIIAGERRFRASKLAGLSEIPAIVMDRDDRKVAEIALIENIQREDLNPIEVAQGIQSLMKQCGYTQETVAQRLSKSRPAVANLLRLLTLPEGVIAMVRQGTLSAGHARVLAGLEDETMKQQLANRTIAEGWSVRQLETAAALLKQDASKLPPKAKKAVHALPVELTELETLCRETFGMRATLTGTAKKGKIVLQYYSQDELERLNELLQQLNGN